MSVITLIMLITFIIIIIIISIISVILSIDPGFDKVGYAFFDKKSSRSNDFEYLASGLIKTAKTSTTSKRLQTIYDQLVALIKQYKPEKLIMEQLFFFKNQKTVIGVAQAQGAIMLLASQHNIQLLFLTPLQIKQIITGYGNADKKSIHKMISLLLNQELKVADDDESDAIACGLAYCYVNENLVQ